MKRIWALLLMTAMVLSLLGGCSGGPAEPSGTPDGDNTASPPNGDAGTSPPEGGGEASPPEGDTGSDTDAPGGGDVPGGETPKDDGEDKTDDGPVVWDDACAPGDSWGWTVSVRLELSGDVPAGGFGYILFGTADGRPALSAGIEAGEDGAIRLAACRFKGTEDRESVLKDAKPVTVDTGKPLLLSVSRSGDETVMRLSLSQSDSVLAEAVTEEISNRDFSKAVRVGFWTECPEIAFSDLKKEELEKPLNEMEQLLSEISPEDRGYYLRIAEQAQKDVRKNFWTGDLKTGKLVPTWNGLPGDDLPDPRGSIWETSMLVFGIYDMWFLTGDSVYEDMLRAEARFFREDFQPWELENAGGNFNWASDDCSWNAMMLLTFYTVTQDEWFLKRAINLLDNTYSRWYDPDKDMMYYGDNSTSMSLYEVGIALSWMRIWEITGQQRFYDQALASYERMQKKLGREDGIYYVESLDEIFSDNPPALSIHEAASNSFLTANMGMASLSVKFYRATGEKEYLDRAYRTTRGILANYNDNGVLLDDRDAWTNGTFTAFYVSDVLSLPGTEEMRELLYATARSIVTNDRTEDGYYGGTWSGPPDAAGSIWTAGGSTPQQCNTTGTAVMIVTAAALLEAGVDDYVR